MQVIDVIALHYCARCRRFATTVTLGGFLTITRCDVCEWFAILTTKRDEVERDVNEIAFGAVERVSEL